MAVFVLSTMPGLPVEGGGKLSRSTSPRQKTRLSRIRPPLRIENAGACFGRRNQPVQHRRDALRIDRKIQPGIFVGGAVGLARLQIEQPVGIDGDGVGLDGGGGRDRAGDDLGLHQQALRARVDQAGAELRKIEDARHQRDKAGQVQRDDAAGEARERQREEKLTGAAQPAERPASPVAAVLVVHAIGIEGR